LFFKELQHTSKYYNTLWKFFSSLYNKEKENLWDFYDEKLVHLNLIPYHSKGINLPTKFNEKQLQYLKTNLDSRIKFIKKYEPEMFIFNGNPWHTLLIENKIVKKFEKKSITSKFNVYFFEIEGIPAILFDKFFTAHFFGLTDKHRTQVIPNLIKEKSKII